MTFDIVVIVLVRYLKSTLKTAETMPRWDKILTYMFVAAISLMVVSAVFHNSWVLRTTDWLADMMLLSLLYILYAKPEFASAKAYMNAIAPYALVSVVKDIFRLFFKDFFDSWHGIFDTAVFFSLVWMVAMLIITRRQQKALLREKLKTQEKEEQNRVTVSLKDQLEVQVAERTAEIMQQKEELQHALDELKATQSQLIQSEKMASLGELTAGIAHEIQNPLNFVNNFSEVNAELIEEMKEEIEKGNIEEAKAIARDIKDNQGKITQHGKRADAIVKGMLQHSRSSNGLKEPTDINALADEYLRLAYHGLRAKDKSFNATMKTDFDESIGNINIIPQDIGRVILNLITNAFYVVNEKKNTPLLRLAGGAIKYEPTVTVTTKKLADTVLIAVKDNGNGIPQQVMDKIFQPFFTTKPSGQGTGLGLSLSYDIIKAHGGELKVETKEGSGSTFSIYLPLKGR